jgi:hypothetical protein
MSTMRARRRSASVAMKPRPAARPPQAEEAPPQRQPWGRVFLAGVAILAILALLAIFNRTAFVAVLILATGLAGLVAILYVASSRPPKPLHTRPGELPGPETSLAGAPLWLGGPNDGRHAGGYDECSSGFDGGIGGSSVGCDSGGGSSCGW